ncbi:uncharacterized protein A4U43_C05F25980 [Asparagus officinalis]|uniref:Uncharacterized protein n=1 Tax=Asparagus officinalis TaxID=4686 RepID=A0A5P1EUP3_ASPOF|nr:uncharacterized protein A4U43_C05F25980 [Asparagus officinalis]
MIWRRRKLRLAIESFEEDLKEKLDDLEKKKIEISYREEQNLMREQLLEGKMQQLQDKEKESDANFRLLKEREESLYREEQKLKAGEVQLAVDIQKLVASKAELESSRAAIYIDKQEVVGEKENLKSMQLEIKQEIGNCRVMKESLTTETEVFIHEKTKFDRELQVLDERRGALETERKQLNHDKEAFNDWRCLEEEKLKSLQLKVKEEAGSCRIMKESLMKETEELIQEKHKYDRMLDERKRALETELKQVNHDRKSFNDWRCIEEEKLRKMRIDIQQESEELRLRKEALEKEYSDYSRVLERMMQVVEEKEDKLCERENKLRRGNQMKMSVVRSPNSFDESNFPEETKRRKLEIDQFEVQNADREQNNLVDAHVGLTKERDHFLAVAAQCKVCRNCGVTASELDSTDLQTPSRSTTEQNNRLEERKDGPRSVHLSGHFSSLRKCSMQFSSSPRETVGCRIEGMSSEPISFGEETSKSKPKYDKASSEIGSRDSKISERLSKDEPETSLETEGTYIRKREGELNVSFNDLPDKEDESKHQNLSAKQRGGHQNSRDQSDTIKDINSVQSVVEDSKVILEETSEEKELRTRNEKAKDVVDIDEGRHQGLVHADQKETSKDQKQNIYLAAGLTTGQLASKGDEVLSANLSVGGSRKKHQTSVPGTPTSGEKRYNFRRSTINRTRHFSAED